MLHAWVVDAIVDGDELRGAIFESKQGRRAILAKVVVDTTGDLDVCAAAGARYESDVEGQGANVQHCLNTAWTWAGIDFARWVAWKRESRRSIASCSRAATRSSATSRRRTPAGATTSALFMGPRLTGYSGLKVADLTAVEIESRRRMTAHLDFFRRNAPGFEDAWLMLSAPAARRAPHAPPRRGAQDGHGGVARRPSATTTRSASRPRRRPSSPTSRSPTAASSRPSSTTSSSAGAMSPPTHRRRPSCARSRSAGSPARRRASRPRSSAGSGTAPRALDVAELQHELRGQGVYLQTAGARAAA